MNWTPGYKKGFASAFAVVNEEAYDVKLIRIEVTGTGNSYVTVYAHGKPRVLSNATVAPKGYTVDSSGIKYVDSGVSQDVASPWVLKAGDNNYSSYKPSNTAGQKTCTWDDNNYVWCTDLTETNEAISNEGDIAYIEIDIIIPKSAPEQSYSLSINLYFEAVS